MTITKLASRLSHSMRAQTLVSTVYGSHAEIVTLVYLWCASLAFAASFFGHMGAYGLHPPIRI